MSFAQDLSSKTSAVWLLSLNHYTVLININCLVLTSCSMLLLYHMKQAKKYVVYSLYAVYSFQVPS